MNIFLIFNKRSEIKLLKEIVNKLTNCQITIFNNSDVIINNDIFENNLITIINKKYNSLYISCIIEYIVENYDTMPDKFIFYTTSILYEIDNNIIKFINQMHESCDVFYISNYISTINVKTTFENIEHDEHGTDFYSKQHLKNMYSLLFEEEINENTIVTIGEGLILLMNKTKINKRPNDYYKNLLKYLINSECIERDEMHIEIILEKIFTGVFTDNVETAPVKVEPVKVEPVNVEPVKVEPMKDDSIYDINIINFYDNTIKMS
jgi:hypothetical protein